jgi:DNA primase (bacterial type)
MKDPIKLKELILEKVDLARIMLDYKVNFMYSPTKADEVQFKCPFHGQDNKPSARYYKATQSCWCWVCQKKWDAVGFVMEKEGLAFVSALNLLVNRYRIDTSSIPDTPEFKNPKVQKISEDSVLMTVLLNSIIEYRKKLPLEKYKVIVSFFYRLAYEKNLGSDVSEGIKKLNAKLEKLSHG